MQIFMNLKRAKEMEKRKNEKIQFSYNLIWLKRYSQKMKINYRKTIVLHKLPIRKKKHFQNNLEKKMS